MKRFFNASLYGYYQKQEMAPFSFRCGYCNTDVSSDMGYRIGENRVGNGPQKGGVYICPSCLGAVFCDFDQTFYPKPAMGSDVDSLPEDIAALYSEARACCGVGGYTAVVLACRKILMHVAVDLGADENKSFLHYVEWLHDHHHIPPHSKPWVDHIRKKGNEANHEIVIAGAEEAKRLVKFIEMLLKVNYEFPALMNEQE